MQRISMWNHGAMDGDAASSPEIEAFIQSALDHHVDDAEAFDNDQWLRFLADARDLRDRGSAAVAAVVRLFRDGGTKERVAAAELLGRMSYDADQAMRDQCWSQLEWMLSAERAGQVNAAVVAAVAWALGHLEDGRALPSLLALAAYPSSEVRFAIACSVPAASGWIARDETTAVLVQLTGDGDADVRDWACFGLGQLGVASPEVREALAARLDDEDEDTRCEALVALAATGDPRAYGKIAERLDDGDPTTLEIEAAAEFADPRLLPALRRLAEEWRQDEDFEVFRGSLERALARCDPERHPVAKAVETRLRSDLGADLASSGRTVRLDGDFPRTRLVILDTDGQTKLIDARIWEHTDPLTFNFAQERASYLLALDTAR
jgi:HEAT repeat protein